MVSKFIRFALLVMAGLLFVEPLLPQLSHSAQLVSQSRTSFGYASHFSDGNETLSCSVSEAAYMTLAEGEAATVKTSRLLNTCLSVTQQEQVFYIHTYWRLLNWGIAALFLLLYFAMRYGEAYGSSYRDSDTDSEGGYIWH